MKRLLFVAVMAWCSCVCAGPPTAVIQHNGTIWYSAGDGSATIVVTNVIHPPGEVPPNNPDDPDIPPDNPNSELTSDVADAARDVGEPLFAKAMGVLYRELSKSVASGKVKPKEVPELLKKGTERMLSLFSSKEDEWKPAIRGIEGYANKHLDANSTAADWSKFLGEVAAGFEDAVEGAAIEDWEKWFEIIMLILRLLGII